jgi:hypothetical protein
MGKFLKHVHGGMIEAISGGTLSRLMDRVREISHLAEYRALMLHGGVNVAQWQNVVSKQQAIAKFALDVVDLLLNYPRLELIISLAIPHEGTTGEDKAQFRGTGTSDTLSKILAFNEELRREFDNMERVRVVDVGCEAPFWRNGRRDVKVYYKDGFHLNRTGTEWLWRVLTQESPWEVIHTSQGQRPYEPDNRDVPKFVVVDDIAAKNEVEVFYDDEVSCDNDQRMSDGEEGVHADAGNFGAPDDAPAEVWEEMAENLELLESDAEDLEWDYEVTDEWLADDEELMPEQ